MLDLVNWRGFRRLPLPPTDRDPSPGEGRTFWGLDVQIPIHPAEGRKFVGWSRPMSPQLFNDKNLRGNTESATIQENFLTTDSVITHPIINRL